jgi:hypothetical protein
MESLMRQPRLAMLTLAVVLSGALGARAEATTSSAAAPTVSCDRIVLQGRTGTEDGFRVLLGAVSVPGPHRLDHGSAAAADRRWRYFRSAGIAIRAGTAAVSVSVPEGWRDRIALSWGGSPASSTLRFAQCDSSPARGAWNSYSGGFHLRMRGDCVPLLVTVGGMSTTVRIGVGRACGGRR